ncbi:DUF2889 domain-containing protein [Cupriavidus sp. NPDC089707]|uniref:DUF2889 domain-containing protein n=1 Tax=Cupriavidus sp. NPDC089707 TaxID=3363963 RepID=UPI00381BAB30
MPPPNRKPLHTRQITCTGYLRDDGLIDVEAELKDISPDGTHLLFKEVPPGGAIHHMHVSATIDMDLVIRDITARMAAGPSDICPEIEPAYGALKGVALRTGFRQAVKARVGGVKGCTHMTDLLGPMATTAVQSRFSLDRAARNGRLPADEAGPMPRPALVGTCHTYRIDSRAVAILWPPHRRLNNEDADGSAGAEVSG